MKKRNSIETKIEISLIICLIIWTADYVLAVVKK